MLGFVTLAPIGRTKPVPRPLPLPPGIEAGRFIGWRRFPLRRADWVIAVALAGVALAARAPLILRGQTLLHSDEAIVGIMAQDIAAGRAWPIFFYGQRYMGSLEAYVVAALTPLFDNPVMALRFGPALFFAAFAAVGFLMLRRWFGRTAGLIGAGVLIAGPPMLAEWSISARGGYVEILLWGALILWAYSEWFVEPRPARGAGRHKFALGLLVGSGLWINPSVAIFVLTMLLHALLAGPWGGMQRARRWLDRLGLLALPALAVAAWMGVTTLWSVRVIDGHVHSQLMLGLLPRGPALVMLALLSGVGILLARRAVLTGLRLAAAAGGPMIFGALVGALPMAAYVVGGALGRHPIEPSLPMGLRPVWTMGETIKYLLHGLPMLVGADPRPFLQLVTIGRAPVTPAMDIMTSSAMIAASLLTYGALISLTCCFVLGRGAALGGLLRLRAIHHGPAMLLLIGLLVTLGLYVSGGCVMSFTTIRYLLPMWVFLPGLAGAACADRRRAPRLVVIALCGAWAVGQWGLFRQLGREHPLAPVAARLVADGPAVGVAELLDAHLLSYLTGQRCRLAEYEPFWPRLSHYRPLLPATGPIDYVVETVEGDRQSDWTTAGFPGRSPPETRRLLWPRLERAIEADPTLLVSRRPLAAGYEVVRLRNPLP